MEIIKTTPNLEFDVIYADGTRKRVPEGVLCEAASSGDIVFHSGTDRLAVLIAAAETMLVALGAVPRSLLALAMGMAASDESRAVLRDLAGYANTLLENRSAQDQGVFRLGQMDMQQSVIAMLQDAAEGTSGAVRATLLAAADQVRDMEVLHA